MDLDALREVLYVVGDVDSKGNRYWGGFGSTPNYYLIMPRDPNPPYEWRKVVISARDEHYALQNLVGRIRRHYKRTGELHWAQKALVRGVVW